jgi:hypothetical protein
VVDWYDGYSWDGKSTVFNPFSILNLFMKKEFNNYWFTSGTPTFLIKQIREQHLPLHKISNTFVERNFFDSFRLQHLDPYQLLFQTGYLTIKKATGNFKMQRYLLTYPNFEVEQSFLNHLLADIASTESGW